MTPACWLPPSRTTGGTGIEHGARLRDESLVAPELIDLETGSVIRRLLRAGHLDARRARLAIADLSDLPKRRASHRSLLLRSWELRESLTVYDAAYVALAEILGVVLVTADARLTRASGPRCRFDLLG